MNYTKTAIGQLTNYGAQPSLVYRVEIMEH